MPRTANSFARLPHSHELDVSTISCEEVEKLNSGLLRILSVTPSADYTVMVTLTDGTTRSIDLESHLVGGVLTPLRESRELFLQVFVDPISGTLAWPGGLDLDPDVLLGTPVALGR